MPDWLNRGELRPRGDDFEIWEDGQRVGEVRNQGDRFDVYQRGQKVAELHPSGSGFDVRSGLFWGKTGEIRKQGRDYHVYDWGNREQEISPSRGFHAGRFDVRDVQARRDPVDDAIMRTATTAATGAGWLVGGVIEALFNAATAKRMRSAPVDPDEPMF
ncbi:MAG: hypothetical protein QM692_10205 [Thermomicrobiales bacterium]